jgi:hypothetical protein
LCRILNQWFLPPRIWRIGIGRGAIGRTPPDQAGRPAGERSTLLWELPIAAIVCTMM